MRRAARTCGVAGLALLLAALPCRAEEPLQPYQMVRSLQLVQDRIAAGDHAALPMQAKLLELVDARFRAAGADELQEPRNLHALLVYGMSGGNPATVEAAAARVKLDAENHAIVDGIVAYLSGNPAGAMNALQDIEPMALPSDLGAFVALVEGSLLAAQEPAQALALFDKARLLSPGTLVEEAALRRSIKIAALTGDAPRFARASTQYVERFLHSPYASQFADNFVSGVVALHQAISQESLADITSMMDAEREKVIYLRIARRAAIDGLTDLSAYASARAEQGRGGDRNDDDPRALLYASLSTLTSDNVEEVRARLKRIDRSRLSENDRSLLDAAQTITREVVAPPPEPLSPATGAAGPTATQAEAPPGEAQDSHTDATDLPPVEGAVAERPAVAPAPAASPVSSEQAGLPPAAPAANAASGDPTDSAIADARRKLDTIDQMLGASPQ